MTARRKPWERMSQDKKKRAERLARRSPSIYFFRCRTFIKIGWTTDVATRLTCIQVANPDDVFVVALMRGGEREEVVLHRVFRPLFHRAEWFREEGALAELISLIGNEEPTEARKVAGDWLLKTFGKTDLLCEASSSCADSGRTKTGTWDSGLEENDTEFNHLRA